MTNDLAVVRAIANDFLASEFTPEGRHVSLADFFDWFYAQRRHQTLTVQQMPLTELDQWHFTRDPCRLAHRDGRFFAIEGLRITTNFGPLATWDQPIIRQPEIGILGIITREIEGVRHFLIQAKVEPGNINGVQLSPTVQATRSNYTRAHGGKLPLYLEYFLENGRAQILVDQLQGEQGSRFLRKRNRNMIVEVTEEITPAEGFCWLTLGQIKRLLKYDNLVNMDTRSVIACVPFVDLHTNQREWQDNLPLSDFARGLSNSLFDRQAALHSIEQILSWLTDLHTRYWMRVEPRSLDCLNQWHVTKQEIHHESGNFFSVIGTSVSTDQREVSSWQQPLLKHDGYGVNGFLVQNINGAIHFLVRACCYAGNHELFELGSTVSRSNANAHFGKPDAPPLLNLFHDPPREWIRYTAIQSEEGGRFYHYQNRYIILELPTTERIDVPETHCWMTLGQIQELVRHGYFNIEARNLLACLDLSGNSLKGG